MLGSGHTRRNIVIVTQQAQLGRAGEGEKVWGGEGERKKKEKKIMETMGKDGRSTKR